MALTKSRKTSFLNTTPLVGALCLAALLGFVLAHYTGRTTPTDLSSVVVSIDRASDEIVGLRAEVRGLRDSLEALAEQNRALSERLGALAERGSPEPPDVVVKVIRVPQVVKAPRRPLCKFPARFVKRLFPRRVGCRLD